MRLVKEQGLLDILAHAARGGGGHGQARRLREALPEGCQLAVFRAEIVPPFGDAVRFVNCQEVHLEPGEQSQDAVGEQRFGRHVQQFDLAAAHAFHVGSVIFPGQRAV